MENRHVIIGTAGHVDHGKTTLIKALTGIDTDRLKEEKERGMTIDLGFASLVLPSGERVGIVDVPGHERFLKNMLAGATGVDVVLLVIAADEGVMPQTREHLEILELLEAREGIVALTKADMVEPEWLELVVEDVRAALGKTFLASAPIVPVSGVTGQGVKELASELARLVAEVETKTASGPFRLPVDRVFTMTGFGAVVTGTLVSGTLRVGDPVRVLPEGKETRVRQIQVHGVKENEASAGTRVAVNLAGIELANLERGSVLVPPGYLSASIRVDAFVRMLPNAARPLKNRARVRLHIGTAEHIGRISLLGAEEIAPGSGGFVQFVSETPVVGARGDRFVLRSYSPMRTIGGGTVLDPSAERHRAKDTRVIETLRTRQKGEKHDLVEDVVIVAAGPSPAKEVFARANVQESDGREVVERLEAEGRVIRLDGDRLIHIFVLESIASRVRSALEAFHQANHLKSGMPKEELRAASTRGIDTKSFGVILARLESMSRVSIEESLVRLPEHSIVLTDEEAQVAEAIETRFKEAGLNPPERADAISSLGAQAQEVFQYLLDSGTIVKIGDDVYLHKTALEHAEKLIREAASGGAKITVSGFRDLTSSSRKYVVPLLEYFDTKRITRRVGDERMVIGSG